MNLCDYLVGNTDRHCGNWLFLYDDTGITGYAPLMDFNHAFEANNDTSCLPYGYVYNESISQYNAERIALEKTDIHLPDIDLSEFKYGSYTMKRIKKLLDPPPPLLLIPIPSVPDISLILLQPLQVSSPV